MSSIQAKRYDRGMKLLEIGSLQRLRRLLLNDVQGHVLEIGTGTGANLPIYHAASLITGIDVSQDRLVGAKDKMAQRPFTPTVANAHNLPFAENSFDNVVGTLVFCSIPYPEQALAEIKRVLRPNGRLYLLEHVRGQTPVTRRLTDWLQPFWFSLQGECHLNRETAVTVQQAGFHIERSSQHGWGVLQLLTAVPLQNNSHTTTALKA
ncbi:MAG: class I SAM-dependent methyltransferase [Anaerolineales bacterium]|nr:class I SAM-dependent methyltransferase [Anaerolineales bacterium]MCA9927006.1 class I SAM-dependent methyltransferase [Anaerolineales bacterium]